MKLFINFFSQDFHFVASLNCHDNCHNAFDSASTLARLGYLRVTTLLQIRSGRKESAFPRQSWIAAVEMFTHSTLSNRVAAEST